MKLMTLNLASIDSMLATSFWSSFSFSAISDSSACKSVKISGLKADNLKMLGNSHLCIQMPAMFFVNERRMSLYLGISNQLQQCHAEIKGFRHNFE